MGVRRKKGNHGKRKKSSNAYFKREQYINKCIDEFRIIVFKHDIVNESLYFRANRLRLKIKELLRIQGHDVSFQSRKRRYVYYNQTANFKGLYVTWKKETYPLYLKLKFDFPAHIIINLNIFYKNIKTGGVISFNIF